MNDEYIKELDARIKECKKLIADCKEFNRERFSWAQGNAVFAGIIMRKYILDLKNTLMDLEMRKATYFSCQNHALPPIPDPCCRREKI